MDFFEFDEPHPRSDLIWEKFEIRKMFKTLKTNFFFVQLKQVYIYIWKNLKILTPFHPSQKVHILDFLIFGADTFWTFSTFCYIFYSDPSLK